MGFIDSKNKEIYEILNVRFKKYISSDRINNEVQKFADRINKDYSGQKVLFIVVLKGSIFFASDLLRKIEVECEVETVRASSYGNEMINSKLRLSIENIDVFNKHILIVEDIVDTGNTLFELVKRIKSENPKSVEIVTFLSKPHNRQQPIENKYVGIEIAPYFVIGYGMEYAEQGRNLADIYILEDEINKT